MSLLRLTKFTTSGAIIGASLLNHAAVAAETNPQLSKRKGLTSTERNITNEAKADARFSNPDVLSQTIQDLLKQWDLVSSTPNEPIC